MIQDVGSAPAHLLLLDTCGASGSVALAAVGSDVRILGQEILPGRSASERLMAAIRSLLAGHSVGLESLAAISVVTGPGSFTGVRVGLSAAKGLAEALNVPLIALSRLGVLAGQARSCETVAVLDAGRGEFYCGHYISDECVREQLCTRDAVSLLASSAPNGRVIGCEPDVAEALRPVPVQLLEQITAREGMDSAVLRFQRGDFADPVTLDANYVRRTDVELFGPRPVANPVAR